LLNWLRQAFPSNTVGSGHKINRRIPKDVKKDLLWWPKFLPGYKGVSIMSLENWSSPDEDLSSDTCLDGFGAISSNQFVHALFPSFSKENQLHINCLELLAIVIATKIWGHKIKGKQILIFCDNEASVYVTNSGSTKDTFMQNCLRELCYIEAIYQFEIKAKHIVGEENRLADYLSRWHIHNRYHNRFASRVEFQNFEEIQVPDSCYHFLNSW
jgi:hypothetical protein